MIVLGDIFGFVEEVGGETLVGWALRAGGVEPLRLTLCIDGIPKLDFVCNIERLDAFKACEDLSDIPLHDARLGFVVDIPKEYFDDVTHTVQIRSDAGNFVQLLTIGADWQDTWFFTVPPDKVLGQVEATTLEAPIHGWVVIRDRVTGEMRSRNRVRVLTRSHVIDEFDADLWRPDVEQVIGADPNCGFIYTPDPFKIGTEVTALHFVIVPQNVELSSSPVQVHCAIPDGFVPPGKSIETILPAMRPDPGASPQLCVEFDNHLRVDSKCP